jgi:predicted XRE-type DNA-binding protein
VRIAQLIVQIITKSHMTQKEAAEVLGMTQLKGLIDYEWAPGGVLS